MSRQKWIPIEARHVFYGLVLLPFAVIAGASWLNDRLVHCWKFRKAVGSILDTEASAVLPGRFVSKLYLWSIAEIAMWLAIGIAVLVAGAILLKTLHGREGAITLCVAVFGGVAAAGSFLLWAPQKENCLSQELFASTLAQVKSGVESTKVWDIVSDIFTVNQAMAVFGIVLIAIAASSTAVRRWDSSSAESKNLAAQSRDLRNLLFAAAVALVLAVLVIGTLHEMSLSMLDKPAKGQPSGLRGEIVALTEGLTVFWGGTLTLVLAVIFGPIFALYHLRVSRFWASQSDTDDDEVIWRKRHGLKDGWLAEVSKVLAVLAPLLAAPLGNLLSSIVKLGG